jgi:Uma2 family endonuclease
MYTSWMAIVQSRTQTLDEFLELPEEKPALEYVAGEVSHKVSPKSRHSLLQARLVSYLLTAGQEGERALALTELRCTFAGSSVVPDISLVAWDRVPVGNDETVVDDFFAAPDVAIEISSPGQSPASLVRRCLWYVDNGVQVALLIDPDDQSVLMFRPGQQGIALHGEDDVALPEILPDLKLHAAQIFSFARRRQ